jgi:hypothetical protein
LIPYEELPESEKEYDRSAAMLTLKAITALGYRIVVRVRKICLSEGNGKPIMTNKTIPDFGTFQEARDKTSSFDCKTKRC